MTQEKDECPDTFNILDKVICEKWPEFVDPINRNTSTFHELYDAAHIGFQAAWAMRANLSEKQISSYPRETSDRYEIKVGRFGAYLFDKSIALPLDLPGIVEGMNRKDFRTRQLRWYVETYGEVPLPQPPKGG